MKKTNSQNYSDPYRYMGLNKIKAPKDTTVGQPKADRITGNGDLRGGKSK